MATAKHRAIDLVRRRARYDQKLREIGRDLESRPEHSGEPDVDAMDDSIGDDLLRLIFIACHPVLSPEARAALTLRLLCGLTTAEIARAFLVPERTVAQRIVRAKRTLADRRVPFEMLIRHGLQALERARQLGGAPGPYEVQAEIAACHARAGSRRRAGSSTVPPS
jgi:predicted RNA polymerase sigma factor